MLKKETCAEIWGCYREIETAEKLLVDMEELKKQYPDDEHKQHLKDAFGRNQKLQLGIPSGENSHRLFAVDPDLANAVIKSHIATQRARLLKLNELAKIQLEIAEKTLKNENLKV